MELPVVRKPQPPAYETAPVNPTRTNISNDNPSGVINRFYKDRLFKALFGSEERKDLTLELYNAINHTSYSNPDDLQINTIEDVVYMGMKNDVSFLLASDLNMYEQQSTWNPNMPLRCFLYAAHALEKYIHDTDQAAQMFLSTLVKVPTPRLVVLYNGIQEMDDMILRLSDCFEKPEGDLEARVHVYNINTGHRLPRICRPLEEYSLFVSTYRDKVTKVGPNQAADEALAALPDGRVKKYLYSQKGEVIDMLLTEYDEQAVMQAIAQEAEAKGEKRGISIGEKTGVLVAISIPIFTSQLEKAREATDLANIRSAYAELTAEYLTNGSDTSTTELPADKTVKVTQKQANWQSVGDGKSATTTIANNVSVPSATSGNYTVHIDNAGVVTVTVA